MPQQQQYGLIQTLAPLHVGATAGEENGNLNLIFRDQFTQTGIIPGSSLRGRFRAEMRTLDPTDTNYWYGHESQAGVSGNMTEGRVKFEYASIVWLPVFCPGQPIVWVSCPRLLKRYQRITGLQPTTFPENLVDYGSQQLQGTQKLFFSFGFFDLKGHQDFSEWFPSGQSFPAVVVSDDEIGIIHDMALYRQSRVRLKEDEKLVDQGGFFNVEALPESTWMVFPIGIRQEDSAQTWDPFFNGYSPQDIFLGGLESIGFGHCQVTISH